MNWVLVSRGRFLTIVGGLSFILVGVVARLHHWQVSSGSKMAVEARDNREGVRIEKAKRGDILDRQGALLASTRALVTLGCDPTAIPFADIAKPVVLKTKGKPDVTEPPLQDQLASILGLKTADLLTLLKPSEGGRQIRWRVIRDSLSEADYSKINSLKIKGIYGNRRYERVYPQESLACHILGFVNKEEMPSSGVESFLDYYLKGTDGWIESNHDALRREIYHHREREVPAQSGFNVELTLDAAVQSYVEEEVAAIVAKFSPLGVSIIVSDPTNAEVLGLANYPNYNPNRPWDPKLSREQNDQAQKNRAVTDIYEPGSTFKIVAISAALETGMTTVNSIWDCAQPTVLLNGKNVDLPDDHHALGRITLDQVIAKSSNRGSALIGCQLGSRKLYDFARAFGFGESTGFGFGGEVRGILHRPESKEWDGKMITRLPIGHSISATPMQVHTAMGVIASGGYLLTPHVVRRVADSDGNTVLETSSSPRRRVISQTTAKSMAWMLAKVVQPGGTATQAEIKGYDAVGKTGTTQKIVNGHYSRTQHVASFSGFFPSANPRLLITITVDEPHGPGVGYGGLVAAPSFKSLSEKLIPYLKISPVPGSELPSLTFAHDR